MKKSPLKLFWWLGGLVALLLLPSVLLASLWVRESIDEVRRVDNALNGLTAIEALFPVVKSRTEGRFTATSDDWLKRVDMIIMDPDGAKSIKDMYLQSIEETSDVKSLATLRKLVGIIARSVKLNVTTPSEISGITNVITDHALTVAEQSLRMLELAQRLKEKETLNAWDHMALPVQGGQFKVTSDSVARFSRNEHSDFSLSEREILKTPSTDYRRANFAFQQAAGKLVRSVSDAKSGEDLEVRPLNDAYPVFASANSTLWLTAIKALKNGLTDRKSVLSTALLITSVVGVLSILIALGGGIIISRAFASRTLQEMDSIGYHDSLTGLPNRRSLIKTLDHLLPEAAKGQKIIGVLHIDLKRFKAINDTYGEPVGDALLRNVADSLTRNSCRYDIVMRTGGNEFMVICQRFDQLEDLSHHAEQIIQEICEPRHVSGQTLKVGAYIGLTGTTGQPVESEQVLMDAALALKAAKVQGALEYQVFEPAMREEFQTGNALADDLRAAIEQGHIEPWFQPQIYIDTGIISGFESLVRWVDPVRGFISPGAFLPTAEAVGLMEDLDEMLRRKALASAKKLRNAGFGARHIGLNITAALLADPDMVDRLVLEVEVAGLTPDLVSIEILESVMIDEAAAAPIKANIERLSSLGFFIELDDFGTGHSGLSSLRDLKVNRVKIDRSFVSGVDQNKELATFTNALIQLALSLDIEVLAEGVETEAEKIWLQDHGCQVVQGFLISKALPEDKLMEWISSRAIHEEQAFKNNKGTQKSAAA